MPLLLSAIFTGINKHTSCVCYGINYSRNKFYDTGPRPHGLIEKLTSLASSALLVKHPQPPHLTSLEKVVVFKLITSDYKENIVNKPDLIESASLLSCIHICWINSYRNILHSFLMYQKRLNMSRSIMRLLSQHIYYDLYM